MKGLHPQLCPRCSGTRKMMYTRPLCRRNGKRQRSTATLRSSQMCLPINRPNLQHKLIKKSQKSARLICRPLQNSHDVRSQVLYQRFQRPELFYIISISIFNNRKPDVPCEKLQIQSFLCIKISSQVLNKTADAKYSQIHTNTASAENVQLCIMSQFIPPKHIKHNSHGLSLSSELICSSHTGTPTPNRSRRRLPNVTNIYPDKAHRRHSIALISPNRPTELYKP